MKLVRNFLGLGASEVTIYTNAHWQVVQDGVESIDPLPPYDFGIERVFETSHRGAQTYYDWPVHMAENPQTKSKRCRSYKAPQHLATEQD